MESKYYQHKELHLNFRSLIKVERYESKVIYDRCANKIQENEDQIGLHEQLLALTYERTEQLNVEEPDASTKEIINYENIENVDTYNSLKTGMRILEEQCHMIETCNNMYMPNPATASSPKVAETIGYIIEATLVSKLPPKAQDPTPKRRYNKKYCHKERNITFRSLLEVKRYETNGILPMRGKKKKESNDQSESLAPLLLLISRETRELNEELKASTMERTNLENMHMSNLTASASTAPKVGRRGRKRKMKTMVSLEAKASIGIKQNDEAAPVDDPINDEAALIDVPIIDEPTLINFPINDEAASIDVPINDEAAPIDVSIINEVALIDVPINDETAMIDVPIIYEASLIDVPITYVENFSYLGH
ncbi:hypothetical protein ES332_D13G151100v1 [Gossypium tomentosum]|uniref:Uncharacterized protein n=1 Tax=Gossypium tomentosum TaxID=34277 RepID=A0A5D2HZ93_GOSTO|nr:hypothetical protein ES332_D13G151100v1 [Gossypium tomentosum]